MKKIALILFICCAAISVNAQDAVLFKIKYLPSHTYNMAMKMDMGIDMSIHGDSATRAKMKADGVKQTIAMQMTSVTSADIKTGPLTPQKTFALTTTIKPAVTKATMDGADLPMPQTATSEQIYKGECDADGRLHIKPAAGGVANEQVKAAVMDMINKLQGEIKFPEKPMKVGESFTMEIPMTIPASGLNLDAMMKGKYTLTAIKENKAYFDTDMSMTMDINTQKNGVPLIATGQGTGTGKATYDIKNNFLSNSANQITMNLNMGVQGSKMDMKMQMKSDVTNTIAAVR